MRSLRWWVMYLGSVAVGQMRQGVARADVVRAVTSSSAEVGDTAMSNANFAHEVEFAVDWAVAGFPQVSAPHRLAASLMASRVPETEAGSVAIPWPAFVVALPDRLVSIRAAGGREWWPEDVHVARTGTGYEMWIRSEKTSKLGRGFASANELARMIEQDDVDYHVMDGSAPTLDEAKAITAHNARAMSLLSRLLLGVCIELDQPKHRIVISNGPPPPKPKHIKRGEPKAWTFQLTRDVKVDCREWVRSYLRGDEGTRPSVQTLVRGHHKRQPCGPGGQDRKWIHVEPYWRGPEDAPIAVRAHRLGER